ncbi:MAG: hypothetical protein ACT4QE_11415, partial [Anaerolineales bacterium]
FYLTHKSPALGLMALGFAFPFLGDALRGHYGLRGMRERVESLGGTLNVSGNGSGSVVEALLPIIA